MGFTIEDGTGKGFHAAVNNEQHLLVSSVGVSLEQFINEEDQSTWSIPFEGLNPAGADDYVVYIKNTGDKILDISRIRVMADTAITQVELHAVSGTASGGSDITPVPHTIGASATPSATIQSGTDITGLTNDGILYFIQCAVVNTQYVLVPESNIRIPKNKAVGLLVQTATANVTGVISLFEHD